MVLRIAGFPVWVGPSEIASGAREVLGWTEGALDVVAGLPDRVAALLDDVEGLVGRITAIADQIDGTLKRVDTVMGAIDDVVDASRASVTRVDAVVVEAGAVAGRSGAVVDEAKKASDGASALLGIYQPIAEQAAPLARRFIEEFSEAELRAAIRLVDQLPKLTEHVETDIMPLLTTLNNVGPDVHELLNQLDEVRQAIQGIPGFKMLVRRGEREDVEANR